MTEAEIKLRSAVSDLKLYETLTTAEYLMVLNRALSELTWSVLKYAIRQERHGNTDKPGGFE